MAPTRKIRNINIVSGNNVYLFNALGPVIMAFSLRFVISSPQLGIYIAVIACHIASIVFYRKKGVACRFNAMQSTLLLLMALWMLLLSYMLFGFRDIPFAEGISAAIRLQANGVMQWLFTLSLAFVMLVYYGLSVICFLQGRERIFALPIIGSWAWQSAILDDTSGEYAPLDEASK